MTEFASAARRHRGMIAACMVTAPLLQTLDTTIANVALPHMQGALSATTDQISWVLTSYLLAAAIVTPAVGWLANRFGRRRMFLVSMAGFTLASMACGAAQSLTEMVVFRLVQGMFGAALVPLSQSVMLDMYEPHERGQAMSWWATGVMLGPIIGPTLGAWLTDTYNWRYVFYVNLPVGVIGFLGMAAFLPRAPMRRDVPFDWFGFTCLSLAIAGLQLMLDRGETKEWFDSDEIMLECTLFALGLFLFLVHMLMARRPFLSRATFLDRNFSVCFLVQATVAMVMNTTAALLPPFFQTLGNYPVLLSGIAMAPRGLGTMLAGPLVGRLMNWVDPRLLMLLGLAVLGYASWAMAQWTPDTSIGAQMPMVLLQGVTISLVFAPLQSLAFSTLPLALRTEATAMISLSRNLGGAIGVSVTETLLARLTQQTHADLARFATPFNRALQSGAPGQYWNPATHQGQTLLDSMVNYYASIVAYRDVFLAVLIGMAPAMLLVLLVRRAPAVAEPGDEEHLVVE